MIEFVEKILLIAVDGPITLAQNVRLALTGKVWVPSLRFCRWYSSAWKLLLSVGSAAVLVFSSWWLALGIAGR